MQDGKRFLAAAELAGRARRVGALLFSFAEFFSFAAFLSVALPVHAGSVSASLSVSVVVPARAVLSVESQPAGLEITEADAARGYIQVPRASLVHGRPD